MTYKAEERFTVESLELFTVVSVDQLVEQVKCQAASLILDPLLLKCP